MHSFAATLSLSRVLAVLHYWRLVCALDASVTCTYVRVVFKHTKASHSDDRGSGNNSYLGVRVRRIESELPELSAPSFRVLISDLCSHCVCVSLSTLTRGYTECISLRRVCETNEDEK